MTYPGPSYRTTQYGEAVGGVINEYICSDLILHIVTPAETSAHAEIWDDNSQYRIRP